MYAPTLFEDRPRSAQIVGAVVAPALIGGLAGILLGVTAAGYWIVAVLAAVGAFLSGFEHPTPPAAARRGAISGAIYGIALLVLHAVVGTHAKVALGSFPPLLTVITAAIGAGLAAIGGRLSPTRRTPRATEQEPSHVR